MDVIFETVMGTFVGVTLLMVLQFWASVHGERSPVLLMGRGPIDQSGWAAAFGMLGLVLFPLSLVMTIVDPLPIAPTYVAAIYGEPSLVLGAVLLVAARYLARGGDAAVDVGRLREAIRPIGWLIFCSGVMLVCGTAAIIWFGVVGAAAVAEPSVEEPIVGLLSPVVENLFFVVVVFGPAAVGCLAFLAATRAGNRVAWMTLYWSWTVSGLGFVLFSVFYFFTHTWRLVNVSNWGIPQ